MLNLRFGGSTLEACHESNLVLSQALAGKGVPHRFAIWPGEAHRARYWSEMIPQYL